MKVIYSRSMAAIAAVATLALSVGAAAADPPNYPRRREGLAAPSSQSIRATFRVAPGQSIQAAVDRARPGDRIEVLPGIYRESVMIDLNDIELAGIVRNGDRPVLDGGGTMSDAVVVSGDNFTIRGFELRNYEGNGVVVHKASNVRFIDLVAHNTGKYGVYPVECTGVLIDSCVVSGVWDAGVYAGQSRDVVIQNSEAYHNTIGFEAENCVNVLFANNSAHQNSLGILVVLLPDLPSKEASNARVIGNRVFENNYPNLSPAGNLVHLVEPGVGIAINSADTTEVTRNIIEGHDSYGVAIYALTDIFADREEFDVDPDPDGNFIHGNQLANNGAKVGERFKGFDAPGGDLFWSGKGVGNGWSEKTKSTFPLNLPHWAGGLAGGGGR